MSQTPQYSPRNRWPPANRTCVVACVHGSTLYMFHNTWHQGHSHAQPCSLYNGSSQRRIVFTNRSQTLANTLWSKHKFVAPPPILEPDLFNATMYTRAHWLRHSSGCRWLLPLSITASEGAVLSHGLSYGQNGVDLLKPEHSIWCRCPW